LDEEHDNFYADGRQFDMLLHDNQELQLGEMTIQVLSTPGHTPACISLQIGDAVFTGDTLFLPDMGTARCDFPGGSVDQLYNSITSRLYTLPDTTRVFVGHDYAPNGRAVAFESTIGESKRTNIQLKADTTLDEFGQFRRARDASLPAPRLILPSLQVNLRNGELPPVESNGVAYLKLPINVIGANKLQK
jgi:glyoxylase-like metal-dependent hydrolase (beta-lactamase superfamily II)